MSEADAAALPETLRDPAVRWSSVRCVVLADGEHYPVVVRDAVRVLVAAGWDVQAVALLGGTEKLREEHPDFGAPLLTGDGPVAALRAAIVAHAPAWVVDLSDEPVSVLERRLALIAIAAAEGVSYAGPDTIVQAPHPTTVAVPTLAVLGTGKRIGKTAVGAHVARVAQAGFGETVVVAMGRGGPADPVVIDRLDGPVDVAYLLRLSRAGQHAASDYLEDAALAGVTTIGCRRAGGGLLGMPVSTNVPAGVALAASLGPELIVLEGSGSVTPPIDGHATVLLASARRPQDITGGLGAYRLARADLVLFVCADPTEAVPIAAAAHAIDPSLETIAIDLVPTPRDDVDGQRVAVFTTAPPAVGDRVRAAIAAVGADPVLVSHSLSDRAALRFDVEAAVSLGIDRFVVELKAAAIDVVAEAAEAAGIPVTLLDNRPVAHDPGTDLDARLLDLARLAARRAGPDGR